VTTSGLGGAIKDWVDTDDERSSGGFEDGDYLALDPPYRAANQNMTSVSELGAVQGMTAPLYDQLLPLVCALPGTSISISTPRRSRCCLRWRTRSTR